MVAVLIATVALAIYLKLGHFCFRSNSYFLSGLAFSGPALITLVNIFYADFYLRDFYFIGVSFIIGAFISFVGQRRRFILARRLENTIILNAIRETPTPTSLRH